MPCFAQLQCFTVNFINLLVFSICLVNFRIAHPHSTFKTRLSCYRVKKQLKEYRQCNFPRLSFIRVYWFVYRVTLARLFPVKVPCNIAFANVQATFQILSKLFPVYQLLLRDWNWTTVPNSIAQNDWTSLAHDRPSGKFKCTSALNKLQITVKRASFGPPALIKFIRATSLASKGQIHWHDY